MNKFFYSMMPRRISEDYYLRRKTEYTLLFLLVLTPYIITASVMKFITEGNSSQAHIINIFLIAALAVVFTVFRKGHITATINLMILLGFTKGLELMIAVNNTLFFIHLFLVIISGAAVHTKKYQLYVIYIVTVLMFTGKIIINIHYHSAGYITGYALDQVYHSVYTGLVFLLTVYYITRIIEKEISLSRELENLANTDSLTGAYNRRKFSKHQANSPDSGRKAFCMIDIDHFKRVNDTWGHEAGDRVLMELTTLVKGMLRDEDLLYRWGGEEFLLILSCSSTAEAKTIVERIRLAVMHHSFADKIPVTLSAGIAMQGDNDEFMAPLRKADVALYNAKKSGRNRTEVL